MDAFNYERNSSLKLLVQSPASIPVPETLRQLDETLGTGSGREDNETPAAMATAAAADPNAPPVPAPGDESAMMVCRARIRPRCSIFNFAACPVTATTQRWRNYKLGRQVSILEENNLALKQEIQRYELERKTQSTIRTMMADNGTDSRARKIAELSQVGDKLLEELQGVLCLHFFAEVSGGASAVTDVVAVQRAMWIFRGRTT